MTKKGPKPKQKVVVKELVEKDTNESGDAEYDEEVNSGFGSYLKSSAGKNSSFKFQFVQFSSPISGQETLRLFVVVNSLVMFMTIAWPQMKVAFETLSDFITEIFGSSELF